LRLSDILNPLNAPAIRGAISRARMSLHGVRYMEYTHNGHAVRSIITSEGEMSVEEYKARWADEDDDEDEYEDGLDEVGSEYGYEGTLIDDDVWEDALKFKGIRDKFPTQHIMKVVGYTGRNFVELDEWLKENTRQEYRRVGWASGCSTTVAVVFWDATDAILYRMRWQ
jgi:hypothetical protein